jgi:hypothetical protein
LKRNKIRVLPFIKVNRPADLPSASQLAEQTDDPVIKNEMLELSSVCEEIANNIEDRLTGG